MPFLQSSGAISINNLKTAFGGPTSPSLSNYYRGGSYVPSQKTVNVFEGPFFMENYRYWSVSYGPSWIGTNVVWDGEMLIETSPTIWEGTSFNRTTTGTFYYYRGALWDEIMVGDSPVKRYMVSREYSVYQSMNTSVPSSGTISLNNFYNAEYF